MRTSNELRDLARWEKRRHQLLHRHAPIDYARGWYGKPRAKGRARR